MIPTIAILSSSIVGIAAWAVWPLLCNDMDRSIDMTAMSILAMGGLSFIGCATMLVVLV